MATQQIDEYYESLAYWKQQAQDYEQALRDIKCNTIMNMDAYIEQLKADARMAELNRQSLWDDSVKMNDKIQQLKSKLAKAKTSLNNALNYLHWREDDLIGDDFKGDGKLTAEYKNKVSEIEKSISEIGGGQMKKNKLLVSITTTKIYEYNTDTETSDIALDEFNNQTGKKFKLYHQEKTTEIQDFIINKPKEKKK